MKKYFILLLIIFSSYFLPGQGIKVDAILGINASQLDGDQMAGFNKLGLLVGGGAGIDLKENFEVQFRILFSQKGSRFTENDPADFNFRLNYLDFPLVFQYRLKEGLFDFSENIGLEAGLQFSYLLSAKEGNPLIGFERQYDDFEPRIYGFLLGCSYHWFRYSFRLNYQRALVSNSKFNSVIGFSLDRTLSLSVAYKLQSQKN